MTTPWKHRYAQRTEQMHHSAIRTLLKLTQHSDIISFAGGLPAPELFPTEAILTATERVMFRQSAEALQYGTTEGYLPLRRYICDMIRQYGIAAQPDNILITSGAQQAIDLIGMLLINPGDTILTETPTYVGALQAWRAYQANFVTVPVDEDGLDVSRLEHALSSGAKFMYILPNFQNPSGVTLSRERRLQLIDAADHYGIPIIEDDPYGSLRYEGEHLPPLIVLDNARLNRRLQSDDFSFGNVIYLSTFSKTLAPSLRLGWMVAPRAVIEKAVAAKQGMDLHTSMLTQMIAYDVVKDGYLRRHVHNLRQAYRERRDTMIDAMSEFFPSEVTWTEPQGGLFLWVTLPPQVDSRDMLKDALEKGVAFVPGNAFDPANAQCNTFRLNFSNSTPEKIVEGIEKLGGVLDDAIARAPIFYGGS